MYKWLHLNQYDDLLLVLICISMTRIGLKCNTLFLFVLLLSGAVLAQKATKNNYYGSWGSGSSWVGGVAPNYTALPAPINENYTIQGYINVGTISANQNLTFSANKDSYRITINDTLVVYGDVDFANRSMDLIIGNGGLLIILGNLQMNNRIDVSSNGSIVVQGTFNKTGSQGSYNGSGSVYAGAYTGDAGNLVPDTQEKDTDSELQADLPDIFDFLQGNGNTPLPVELISFKAQAVGDDILISWSTATEFNNSHFTLERSKDGLEFRELAQVAGKGTSSIRQDYSFTDSNPSLGLSYYRLSQTDYDGTTEVFKAISVVFDGPSNSFSVYPNPVHGQSVTLQSSGWAKTELISLNIYNVTGMLVAQRSFTSDSFGNIDESIQLGNLLEIGLYMFELSGSHRKARLKVVSQ